VRTAAGDGSGGDGTTGHGTAGTTGADGALLVDDTGRDQLLAGVWHTAALRAAVAAATAVRQDRNPGQGEDPGGSGRVRGAGVPVRRVLASLSYTRVTAAPGRPVWLDVDTDEDLIRAGEWT
jgi:hypothetical protein